MAQIFPLRLQEDSGLEKKGHFQQQQSKQNEKLKRLGGSLRHIRKNSQLIFGFFDEVLF